MSRCSPGIWNVANVAPEPSATQLKVVERGPHHRVVEWFTQTTNEFGSTQTFTNHYTEIGSGLNYLAENTGSPLSATTFTSTTLSGTNRYMVRAVSLQATGSGSYTNLSQGAFTTFP